VAALLLLLLLMLCNNLYSLVMFLGRMAHIDERHLQCMFCEQLAAQVYVSGVLCGCAFECMHQCGRACVCATGESR
jgi:hypothetical protein